MQTQWMCRGLKARERGERQTVSMTAVAMGTSSFPSGAASSITSGVVSAGGKLPTPQQGTQAHHLPGDDAQTHSDRAQFAFCPASPGAERAP